MIGMIEEKSERSMSILYTDVRVILTNTDTSNFNIGDQIDTNLNAGLLESVVTVPSALPIE